MANKKNVEYWQKRFEDILVDNEKLAVNYEKEMAKIYEQRKLELQKELESFYQRYSDETGLSLAEVKKRLNPAELKRFKTQQKGYLEYMDSLVKKGANLGDYEAKIKELSGKAYVTRLQELQYNLNTQIMTLTGEQEVKLKDVMKESYLQGYFKSVYEVQKGLGMGMSFSVPNTDDVEKVLKTNWNGNNYSKSIWSNKEKLTNWLGTDLPRHFAAGSSNQNIAKDLAKKLDTNYSNALRLARTEVNHISNQSTMDAYKASRVVDKYEILATLDSRTSEICQGMDGRLFNVKDAKVALNMPPFHPNCRTTTIPYIEPDEFDDDSDTRIARAKDGSSYYVPAHMDYSQWNMKYGQGAKVDKQGMTVVPKDEKPVQLPPTEEPKLKTIADYKKFSQEDVNEWADEITVTKDQDYAIRQYTAGASDGINFNLNDDGILSDRYQGYSDNITSAMSETPTDMRLYKVVSKNRFISRLDDELRHIIDTHDSDVEVWRNNLMGKVLTNKGYESTSWTPNSKYINSRRDPGHVLYRIKTPKGTKAIPIERLSVYEEEKEILLDKGRRYLISNIKEVDDFIYGNKDRPFKRMVIDLEVLE